MFLPFSTNIIRICVWSSKYISPTSECEAKGWEFHARDPTRKQTFIILMLYHLLAFAPVSGWVSEWQFQVWHYRISELRPTRLQSKKRDNFTAVALSLSQLRMWDKRMRVSRKWVLEGADWQMFTDSDIFLFTLVFNRQSKMFYIKCIKWAHFKSSPLPAL